MTCPQPQQAKLFAIESYSEQADFLLRRNEAIAAYCIWDNKFQVRGISFNLDEPIRKMRLH